MMTQPDITQSWQHIQHLSEQMSYAAQKENWPDVATMASQRHSVIEKHFDSFPVGPETASFYVKHLNQLLQQEEPLKALAREARKQIMKHGTELIKGRKMQRAYGS